MEDNFKILIADDEPEILSLLEKEFLVIHDPAYRILRIGRNADQVEFRFLSTALCLFERYNTDHVAFCVNKADLREFDRIIDQLILVSL